MSLGSRNPTVEEMASWPPPNFVNPQTRAPLVVGVEVPLTSIALIFVVARFYSRLTLTAKRQLGWDDWLMLLSVLLSAAITALHCVATRYALGLHLWDVKLAWIEPTWKISYVTLLLLGPTVSFTKISLCLTYLKILPAHSDRIFSSIAIFFSVSYCISITLVMVFQCSPVSRYWDSSMTNSTCIDEPSFNISAQALNSMSDVLIFLWPARTLWKVRIPVKQRIALIFTFSAGVIVCVAGVFRIYYLKKFFDTYDVYWPGAVIFMLSGIETNVGIICGCLPSIKPIFNRFSTNTIGTTFEKSKDQSIHRRLPGARLSLQHEPVPELNPKSASQWRSGTPYSVEEHEIPIKLDEEMLSEPSQAHMASRDELNVIASNTARHNRVGSTEKSSVDYKS